MRLACRDVNAVANLQFVLSSRPFDEKCCEVDNDNFSHVFTVSLQAYQPTVTKQSPSMMH